MGDKLQDPGYGVLAALVAVIGVSVWLGEMAQRRLARGSFMKGYFLGNRSLGVWALALTATVQSGGTFMGFPSLVYTYGWVVALWIGSYMVVPITGFAILGKRMAQLSRRTGALTTPDLLRARFDSPAVGLTASLLIIVFMTCMMIAQFKAGAIVMKVAWPHSGVLALAEESDTALDTTYYIGLAVFAVTVVGYTLIGGFLASVWTDLFQSVLMFFGVLILLALAIPAAGGMEHATRTTIAQASPAYALPPGHGRDFLPITLALSMFVHWVFTGVGSPSSIVRLMASENSGHIRRSIVVLSLYNMCIYLPIILIAICGRALLPDLADQGKSDEIIPRLALLATSDVWGGKLITGLILAAPFGAVMSTVSTYLVVIASGLVRDVYQRFLRPDASDREMRLVTYAAMIAVGGVATAACIYPPEHLQTVVVLSTGGAAATLLVPAVMAAYWRRATAAGAVAAMLTGAGTVGVLVLWGLLQAHDPGIGAAKFRPFYLAGFEPVVWGFLVSTVVGVSVSLATTPPPATVVAPLFNARQPSKT